MWIMIFMLCPVIVGFLRYNDLDSAYRMLFYTCCLILFNQLLFYFFRLAPGYKLSPFWNNIFNYYTQLCWRPAFVYVVITWSVTSKKRIVFISFILIVFLLILLEIYFVGLNQIRASLALSLISILGIFIFVYTLNDIFKLSLLKKTKRSMLLVVLPEIITTSFHVSLDLFMYFMYSETTQLIFGNLYGSVMVLGAISYVCMGISILWAPSKEKFI